MVMAMTDSAASPVIPNANKRRNLHDLPIPVDVQPDSSWTDVMIELADHIGAYEALLLVDAKGGTDPYIPVNPAGSRFAAIIGEEKAAILHRVYGLERLQLPVGDIALKHARRAGVIAAIRAKTMSLTEAALIRGMGSRSYISHLVNHSDEGKSARPLAISSGRPGTRQLALFDDQAA